MPNPNRHDALPLTEKARTTRAALVRSAYELFVERFVASLETDR